MRVAARPQTASSRVATPTLRGARFGRAVIKDVIADIGRWRDEGGRIALARVVRTDGSAPRAPGAAMVVNADGRVAGSVSGGCVEGAVVLEALDVLESGETRLVRFGYSDDDAFAVGLTCGGVIDILDSPTLPPMQEELEAALADGTPIVLATVVSQGDEVAEPASSRTPGSEAPTDPAAFSYLPDRGDDELAMASEVRAGMTMLVRADGSVTGGLGHPTLDAVVRRDALGALGAGRSFVRNYGERGEGRGVDVQVFLDVFAPPPRMVIFGAVDFTAALAKVAKVLGYVVTVCDARATFTTRERFPMADEVVVEWPDRWLAANGAELGAKDAVCVLTHDPKFDVPAIMAALSTDVGYIGAMGSRRTHGDRVARLIEAGCDEEALARVMAPIGLDIGARTPEETAVAICAEIVALQTGSDPRPLRDASGPIHRELEPLS
jgi:xanthine dehydrogenase accessory factor